MIEEYSNFNDVNDVELKAWNRAAVAFNIAADEGLVKMKEYVGQFSDEDRVLISATFKRIKDDGYERTRAAISRGYQSRRPADDGFSDAEETG